MDKERKRRDIDFASWVERFAIIIIMVGCVFFWSTYKTLAIAGTTLDNISKFGDFNSGFSGVLISLGAALLFYSSIRIQKKELTLQREELKLTREEVSNTNNLYEEQKQQNLLFSLYHARRDLFSKLQVSKKNLIQEELRKNENGRDKGSLYDTMVLKSEMDKADFDEYYGFYALNIFRKYLDYKIPNGSNDEIRRILNISIKEADDEIGQQVITYLHSFEFLIQTISSIQKSIDKSFFYNMIFNNLHDCEKWFITIYSGWKQQNTESIIKIYLQDYN